MNRPAAEHRKASRQKRWALDVYDMRGRDVLERAPRPLGSGSHTLVLNTEPLAAGVYTVVVTSGRAQLSRRLIVVR